MRRVKSLLRGLFLVEMAGIESAEALLQLQGLPSAYDCMLLA